MARFSTFEENNYTILNKSSYLNLPSAGVIVVHSHSQEPIFSTINSSNTIISHFCLFYTKQQIVH